MLQLPWWRQFGPSRRPRSAVFCLCLTLLAMLGATATAQPHDPPRGDQRWVVLGDFNGPYGSLTYPAPVARVLAAITGVWRPDLLLSPGDVIAGQSRSLAAADLASMWQAFDDGVAAKLRSADIPYAFAPGNHDASSLTGPGGDYQFPLDRDAAAAYWRQEMYAANLDYLERADFPFNYTFAAGRTFVAVIDASSPTVDAAQRAWLGTALASPAARSAKLRVVVGHLPLVAVAEGRDGAGEVLGDAEQLAELFSAGAVDLYISGHHAAYYPGRLGELELLFAGGIGARRLLGDDGPPRSTVTVVDVWYQPLQLVYTTYDAATLEPLAAESLPAALSSGVRLSTRARPPVADR